MDEIQLHIAPLLLGEGIRLFEMLRNGPVALEARDLAARELIDMRFGSRSRAAMAGWTRA